MITIIAYMPDIILYDCSGSTCMVHVKEESVEDARVEIFNGNQSYIPVPRYIPVPLLQPQPEPVAPTQPVRQKMFLVACHITYSDTRHGTHASWLFVPYQDGHADEIKYTIDGKTTTNESAPRWYQSYNSVDGSYSFVPAAAPGYTLHLSNGTDVTTEKGTAVTKFDATMLFKDRSMASGYCAWTKQPVY